MLAAAALEVSWPAVVIILLVAAMLTVKDLGE